MKIVNASQNFEGAIPSNLASLVHEQIAVNMRDRDYPLYNFTFKRFGTRHWNWHLETLLDEVPVYLVTTDQAGQTISVCGREVAVPQNNYIPRSYEEPVGEWFDEMQDKYACPDYVYDELPETFFPNDYTSGIDYAASELPAPIYEPARHESGPSLSTYSIYDPYGVYRRNAADSVIPAEIFVWVDLVRDALDALVLPAVDDCGEPRFCPEDNWFGSVLQFVVQMEYAHYLMDPRTYKAYVHPDFDVDCPLYQYYEAANATRFALITMDARGNNEEMETVGLFIASMPEEYAVADNTYGKVHNYQVGISMWLGDKVMFDDVTFFNMRCLWYKIGHRTPCVRMRSSSMFVTPFYPRFSVKDIHDMHQMYMCRRDGVYCFSDDITNHRADRHWHIYCPGLQNNCYLRYDCGLFVIKGDLKNIYRLYNTPYFAVQMVGSKWGVLDSECRWITSLEYDSVSSYDGLELIEVGIRTDGGMKYGIINAEGKIIVPVKYDNIESPACDWKGSGSIKAVLNGAETLYIV